HRRRAARGRTAAAARPAGPSGDGGRGVGLVGAAAGLAGPPVTRRPGPDPRRMATKGRSLMNPTTTNPTTTTPATTDAATPLAGKVALVVGATRGAGRAIAVELGRAGAYVYATGRSSRKHGPSEIGRPETIEETGDLVAAAGGAGTGIPVDHSEPDQVEALVARIEAEQGRLDVLVNDAFGGDRYAQWEKPLWEHDLAGGLRMLRMGLDTHLITCRY